LKTIRLWKLGSNSIPPTRDMIQKLRDLIRIEDGKGGKVLDLVWGPDIDLSVYTYPDDAEVLDVVQSAEDSQ
jgi:hypothetical protein